MTLVPSELDLGKRDWRKKDFSRLSRMLRVFFRSSPLSFRQVGQHAIACCILPIKRPNAESEV